MPSGGVAFFFAPIYFAVVMVFRDGKITKQSEQQNN